MSRLPVLPAVTAAAAATAAARLAYAGLRLRPPGGQATWSRTNHRGEPVTLLEGPAVAAGGVAGALIAPGLSGRVRAALLVAGAGAAALGSYDDLAGSGSSRGFRGHLGALRHGELTTGAVKLAGIGATGMIASALVGTAASARPARSAGPAVVTGPAVWAGRPVSAGRAVSAGAALTTGPELTTGPALSTGTAESAGTRRPAAPARSMASAAPGAADILINAGLVAGGANLLNLFDLRPGRAIKVALGAGGLMAAAAGSRRPAAAAPLAAIAGPLAAAAALLPEDLGERAMLGDGGANALGAMLGTAAAAGLPRSARLLALAAIVGLTAASEVVSFTKVIERTGPLRRLDMLGRRPAAAPAPAPAPGAAGLPAAPDPGPGELAESTTSAPQ